MDGRFRSVQRALLAVLLLHGGHLVPAEDLYAELWGDELPATVENALQAHVSRLRRTLQSWGDDAPSLVARSAGYVLEFSADDLDVNVFRRRIAQARAVMPTDTTRASVLLNEALGLWVGAPLQDVVAGSLCRSVAVQLEEECLAATEVKLWLDYECRPAGSRPP
ncbi:AfsR/SARP family transcriptional regulator [Streptomyces hypolithicus]